MAFPPEKDQADGRDQRLYIPHPQQCKVGVKSDSAKEYCFQQSPGENHFHLLIHGEVYVQKGDDRYCLNCAFRLGLITRNRQFWKKGEASQS